jgi:hypothetical protein
MNRYEITVIGRLEARRARGLGADGFRSLDGGRTVLLFASLDRAATYGLLARLRDAGLELVSLESVAGGEAPERVTQQPSEAAANEPPHRSDRGPSGKG